MQTGQTLIDTGAEKCGGLRRLADAIHENPGFLSQIRQGKKPIPPSLAARVAVVAGMDARRAALEALVSQEKDHAKAVALALALGVEAPAEPPTPNGMAVQLACKFRTTRKKIAKLFKPSGANDTTKLRGFFGVVL